MKKNDTDLRKLLMGFVALLMLATIASVVVGVIAAFVVLAGPGIVSFFSALSMLDTGVTVALIAGAVSILTVVGGGVPI